MNILQYISRAFSSMRKSFIMTLLTIITITSSLSILFGFFVIYHNSLGLMDRIGNRLEVSAYLKEDVSRESIDGIIREIEGYPEVESVRYVTKDEALAFLRKQLSDDQSILEGLDVNPLPSSILIKVRDELVRPGTVTGLASRLKKAGYFDEVDYGGKWVERLSTVISIARIAGFAAVIGLIISVTLIISNIIGLTVQARRDEIRAMLAGGVSPVSVRLPFYIEGILLGTAGATLATSIFYIIRMIVEDRYGSYLSKVMAVDLDLLPREVIVGVFVLAIASGSIGSMISLVGLSKGNTHPDND